MTSKIDPTYTLPDGYSVSFSKQGDIAIHDGKGFRSLPPDLWIKAHELFIKIIVGEIEYYDEEIERLRKLNV